MIIENSKINYNWIHFVFLSVVDYFEPNETEEGYLEWINKDDIKNIPTPEIDKEVYNAIINNEKFIFNDIYDDNLNLIYAKEELSGKVIVDRR